MKKDTTISSNNVVIQKKKFYFDVRKNNKGKYLRITEKSGGVKNKIIIPFEGVKTFYKALANIINENNKINENNEI